MTTGAGGAAAGAGAGAGAGTGGGAGAAFGAGGGAVWARASRPLAKPLNTMTPRTAAPATPTHMVQGESGACTCGRAEAARAKTGLRSDGVWSLRFIAATTDPSCAAGARWLPRRGSRRCRCE
ncbi:MAG: hypothetical protein EPO51_16210 [Phenylobacterium sp.]|nr:MAG: hypothetical protein EPO51_16210 [Phenylobacterium sp.]